MILVRERPCKTFMVIQKGARGISPFKMLALEDMSGSLCSISWSSTVLGGAVLPAYFCRTRVPTRTSLGPGHRTAEAFWLVLIELLHTHPGVFLSSHHNRCTLLEEEELTGAGDGQERASAMCHYRSDGRTWLIRQLPDSQTLRPCHFVCK